MTIRGTADVIMAMSNIPLLRVFPLPPLPFARRKDRQGVQTMREIRAAMRSGAFHAHGMALHVPMMLHLTRVMSVNG